MAAGSTEFEEDVPPAPSARAALRPTTVVGVAERAAQPDEFDEEISLDQEPYTHADMCIFFGAAWINGPLYRSDDSTPESA